VGQNLLKKKGLNKSEQSKRALNGDINAITRLNNTTISSSTKSSITITNIPTPGNSNNPVKGSPSRTPDSFLKKFSFLSRDKSYLSKLSTYVNKNFSGLDTTSGSIGTIKSAAAKAKLSNGMVFTTIELNAEEETSCGGIHVNSSEVNRQSASINSRRVRHFVYLNVTKTLILEFKN